MVLQQISFGRETQARLDKEKCSKFLFIIFFLKKEQILKILICMK